MDLRALVALAGIVTPELLNRIESSAEVEEADGAGFDRATTRPEEEVMDDPMQSMGSNADLSLRRYLKAKGDHVTVDETVYPDYSVKDVRTEYSAFKEAKDAKNYGPGKIGAVQKMLDKEREDKKAKDDDRDELTKKLFPKRSRADMEKSDRERNRAMNAKRFMKSGKPSRSREWGAYEGVNEAEEGTYMKQWYNYSEDFAMLELYVDGKLVDEWSDYFHSNETGNPLQAKFIEMAKENGVDPVGLKVIDGEDGDEGVFTSSGLKWNSNAATESLNDIKKLAGIEEADLDENAFNQAAAAAARAGKDSFEFNGKTYKTKMDKSTAHKLDDDVDMLRKLAGLAQ